MSLSNRCRMENCEPTRMNTNDSCYSVSLGVSSSWTGLRIRNDEVVGSIPTSSTNPQILGRFAL
jgi:hypothetical protein